jgi:hypothetical protein
MWYALLTPTPSCVGQCKRSVAGSSTPLSSEGVCSLAPSRDLTLLPRLLCH